MGIPVYVLGSGAEQVTDGNGHPYPAGTIVQVSYPPGGPLATVYDPTGTTASNQTGTVGSGPNQPVAVDQGGNITVAVTTAGWYGLSVVLMGLVERIAPVYIGGGGTDPTKLPLAGGAVTGDITLAGIPSQTSGAVPLSVVAGSFNPTVTAAPGGPTVSLPAPQWAIDPSGTPWWLAGAAVTVGWTPAALGPELKLYPIGGP